MEFYFLYALWFIPAIYVLLVWTPSQFGDIYVVAVLLGLFYVEIRFVEMATDSRGLYGRFFKRFWRLTGGPIFTAFKHQLIHQMTRVWNKHSGKFPQKPRDGLVSLRYSIHGIRQNRRVRGRTKLFTIFLGIIAILSVIGYLLYGTYCGFPFSI